MGCWRAKASRAGDRVGRGDDGVLLFVVCIDCTRNRTESTDYRIGSTHTRVARLKEWFVIHFYRCNFFSMSP
jgi:hypothetical protein